MALPEPLTKRTRKMEASRPENDENPVEPFTKRKQKREASHLGNDENPSSDSESESPFCSKTKVQPRMKQELSAFSDYTTGSEDDGETDSSCFSEEERNSSASRWDYNDLMKLNICYDNTPEPLDKFAKEVKDAFVSRKGFCPDPGEMMSTLKKQLTENLTFSYDLRNIRDTWYTSVGYREDKLKKAHQEMEETIKKMWRSSEKMQSEDQFFKELDSSMKTFSQSLLHRMIFAVREFAVETCQLIKKMLFIDQEPVYSSGKRRGGKERGGHGGKTPDNFFQNYSEVFGKMFFLNKGEVKQTSFTFQNQTVRSTPHLVYHFFSEKSDEELLFLREVKASVNQGSIDMEDLAGSSVMGQIGAELLGRSMNSVFYPNSLGILCMETKLIFVFLKISLEHSISMCKGQGGSADNPGKVLYTETFDMLKAEDRLKMAEFLFWLGLLQDSAKYKFF